MNKKRPEKLVLEQPTAVAPSGAHLQGDDPAITKTQPDES
jgi:hypothetical protein